MRNDMNEYNEGDLVEAVKGESVVRGRIHQGGEYRGNRGYRYLGDSGALDEVYLKGGWTVTVIEKAAPVVVLPTEPGYYRVGGNNARVGGTVQLLVDGEWWWVGNSYKPRPHQISAAEVGRSHAPLTPLAPVAETAKKVLDRVDNWPENPNEGFTEFVTRIAKDFGAEL